MKYIFYLLLFSPLFLKAQINLVPNGSFEDTVSCPTSANQIDKAVGWHASGGSPDYFNECDFVSGTTAIPSNFTGYQYAFDGGAYAGFIANNNSAINSREYITCHLVSPLTVGVTYFVSFELSLAGNLVFTLACNKIGMLFSTTEFDSFNNAPTANHSQFFTNSIVTDTLNWINVSGSFVADSNYNFVSIGNFFDDINTDTIWVVNPSTYAYYYVDQISVVSDSAFSNSDFDQSKPATVYPNPTFGELHIALQSNKFESFELYDPIGKRVFADEVITNTYELNYDLSFVGPGIYFATIHYSDFKKHSFKLIKY